LIRPGRIEEGLAVCRAEVEASPNPAANNGAGMVLDLMGAVTPRTAFRQPMRARSHGES